MNYEIDVIYSQEEVEKKIAELAAEISRDYAGEEVKLICILKGGAMFACDLAKKITVPVKFDFMQVSSYGSGTKTSGSVTIKKELDESIAGENVIIVEDIVDSGNTLYKLVDELRLRRPKSLKVCTLLDKPSRRQTDVEIAYRGYEVPDLFVVGYGMDYDQQFRNLPYIGVVKFLEE